MKIRRYCQRLLSKYDLNNDGVLQENEWRSLRGQPQLIDVNGDTIVDLEELIRWTADYGSLREIGVARELAHADNVTIGTDTNEAEKGDGSNAKSANDLPGERRRDLKFYVPAKRIPAGVPDWFFSRDEDGDAQLTIAEFSPTNSAAELAEFARYDVNRDGVMTVQECVSRTSERSESIKTSGNETATGGPPQGPTPVRHKLPKKSK